MQRQPHDHLPKEDSFGTHLPESNWRKMTELERISFHLKGRSETTEAQTG